MSTSTAARPAGTTRARAWVDHLRDGGTTPWRQWSGGDGAPGAPDAWDRPFVPGAQQLELLRRLNLAGAVRGGLADRVLVASTFGRGLADLPLAGLSPADSSPGDAEVPRFGARGVDPGDLPAGELLRVAVLLLADEVATLVPRADPPPSRRAWLRPGYRLDGDPWLAARLESELRRRRRPPGTPRVRIHVLAPPLDVLLAHVWTQRCLSVGAPGWEPWVQRVAGRSLPREADLASRAAEWAGLVGPNRVVVETDSVATRRRLRLPTPGPDAEVGRYAAELGRRVQAALGVVVPDHRRAAVLQQVLVPWLLGHADAGGPTPTVPSVHDDWLEDRAARQRGLLSGAGYTLAGPPADLVPARHRTGPADHRTADEADEADEADDADRLESPDDDETPVPPRHPDDDAVLGLTVRMLAAGPPSEHVRPAVAEDEAS